MQLEFSIFLSSIAVTLINFDFNLNSSTNHGKNDNTTRTPTPPLVDHDHNSQQLLYPSTSPYIPSPNPLQTPLHLQDLTSLNHHSKLRHNISLISASAFTLVACLSLIYSLVLYLYRVDGIRRRRASARYHDRYGPTVLCLAVFLAVVVNCVTRLMVGGRDYEMKPRMGEVELGMGVGKGVEL